MPEYEKYAGMIQTEAWASVKITGIEYEELVSLGNLAFVEACKTWNPELGQFSTHLWNRLRYRVRKAAKKMAGIPWKPHLKPGNGKPAKQLPKTVYLEDLRAELAETGSGFFAAKVAGMSKEAQFVVNLIFNSGVELVDMTADHVRTTRSGIRQYLQSPHGNGKGWSPRKVAKVFAEIKEAVSGDREEVVFVPWFHRVCKRWMYKRTVNYK